MVISGKRSDNTHHQVAIDDHDHLLVASCPEPAAATMLADASSTDGLADIGTVPASGTLVVCAPAGTERKEWQVSSNKAWSYQFARSQEKKLAATLTLSSVATTENLTVNAKTFTAHTDTTVRKTGQFAIDGADDTADAAELVKVLNPGTAVTLANASVDDTLTVCGRTYTAKATAAIASKQFSQAGTDAQDATSLAACLNHKANVTLASVTAGDTVVIGKDGTTYTFTAHATTTTAASREFAINGDNTADAAELVTCINDATYGVPGITASNVLGVLSLTRDSENDVIDSITSSNATRLAVVTAVYGVPGITATVGDGGEVALTSDWATITCTSSNSTRLNVATYGIPGVTATAASGVVTLTATTATVLQAASGTAGAHIVVADTTQANVLKDGAKVTGKGVNSTWGAEPLTQYTEGYPYAYLFFYNDDAAAAATVTIDGVSL